MSIIGLQIPNFTFPGVAERDLFEAVVGIALEAEQAGFDRVMVMDHFYQLPNLGPPENEMLEAYTLLGAIAARTTRVRLGTLVTGNSYRNPAVLAKTVTTLDVVSRGRAIMGIGAGWFEQEHVGYGVEFPPLGERLSRLEEALQIVRPMFRGERPSFEGRFYRTVEALNLPSPLQAGGPAILIGGAGEKRTLRLVARFGDESNLICGVDEIPRKLEALERHCADVGRDRSEIGVSWLASAVIGRTHEQAQSQRDSFLAERGIDWSALPEAVRADLDKRMLVGDADSVGERVQKEVCGAGLDGLIVNLPANAHLPGAVAATAAVLTKAIG